MELYTKRDKRHELSVKPFTLADLEIRGWKFKHIIHLNKEQKEFYLKSIQNEKFQRAF